MRFRAEGDETVRVVIEVNPTQAMGSDVAISPQAAVGAVDGAATDAGGFGGVPGPELESLGEPQETVEATAAGPAPSPIQRDDFPADLLRRAGNGR